VCLLAHRCCLHSIVSANRTMLVVFVDGTPCRMQATKLSAASKAQGMHSVSDEEWT
jgi:hypothetical protein